MLGNYANKNLTEWPAMPISTSDIRIENNKLIEIPDEIKNLKSLKRIIINNNHIEKISFELKNLNFLEDFRLQNNDLTHIPNTIFSLEKLKILLLSDNQISKIPLEIENLKNLNQLHLQNNNIQSLPQEIGKLNNLTHLFLNNNPISYLPHSFRNLQNLSTLDISGTNLPIPPNYNASTAKATIEFVLENQEEPIPELNIKKSNVFLNFSIPSLIEKFEDAFETFHSAYDVEFVMLDNSSNIDKEITFLLIVVGFDIHSDVSEVFNIIEKCEKFKIPYRILFQKDISSVDEVNLAKGSEVYKLRDQLEDVNNNRLIQFNSIGDLNDMIFNVFREHRPEIILKKLELKNIGHFENASIDFHNSLTCIIGENGQGKSSILRALSLAIAGKDDNKFVDEKTLRKLLRIESINKNGDTIYAIEGKITLKYSLDNEDFENIIDIKSEDEGRIIDIKCSGDQEINSGEFNLKSLILGFPQIRGTFNQIVINRKPYSQPHVDDLLPLISFKEDDRLDSFVEWIANLYGEGIKKGNIDSTREGGIIKYVFEVISDLTGSNIKFKTVQKFSPPIIMITSPDAPRGIPLNYISQGFKVVIGWIGYFIQRRFEAFPLSNPNSNYLEKAVLIVDEIDSSIHPIWQQRLLTVLRKNFPNTQIICTTHSPLMIAGLDRDQIMEIHQSEDLFSIEPNDFDTWAATYKDILRLIFNTHEYVPKITKEEIEKKIEITDNKIKKEKLHSTLKRMQENEMLMDQIKRYEQNLKEKEKELNELIVEYRKKV